MLQELFLKCKIVQASDRCLTFMLLILFDDAVPQAVDQDGKSKGSVNGSKVDFITRNGSSHIFPSTQRRLEFDEAEYTDSVTNKMLVVIGKNACDFIIFCEIYFLKDPAISWCVQR